MFNTQAVRKPSYGTMYFHYIILDGLGLFGDHLEIYVALLRKVWQCLLLVLVRIYNIQQLHAIHNTHAQLCTKYLHNAKHSTWFIFICRLIVELCICVQFFTFCTTLAQDIVHNCSKSIKFMHKCTIAQCCALTEYCA